MMRQPEIPFPRRRASRNAPEWLVAVALSAALSVLPTLPAAAGRAEQSAVDSLNGEAYRLFCRRDFRSAEAAARRARALCGPRTGTEAFGIAAANLAALLTIKARFARAAILQHEADSAFAAAGLRHRRGRLQVARAVTCYLSARKYSDAEPEQAIREVRRALSLLDSTDIRVCAVAAGMLGHSNVPKRFQAGYTDLVHLMRDCEHAHQHGWASVCARHLAVIEGTSGGHRTALRYFTRALELERGQGHDAEACEMLRNLAVARRKLADHGGAEAALLESLELAESLGDLRMQFVGWNDLALLFTETGRLQDAERADARADSVQRVIVSKLRAGTLDDTILFDYHELLRQRYANLPPYRTDPFEGFCDQLAINPAE
jgi:tetratricopeptide (TPR) repeat protein